MPVDNGISAQLVYVLPGQVKTATSPDEARVGRPRRGGEPDVAKAPAREPVGAVGAPRGIGEESYPNVERVAETTKLGRVAGENRQERYVLPPLERLLHLDQVLLAGESVHVAEEVEEDEATAELGQRHLLPVGVLETEVRSRHFERSRSRSSESRSSLPGPT